MQEWQAMRTFSLCAIHQNDFMFCPELWLKAEGCPLLISSHPLLHRKYESLEPGWLVHLNIYSLSVKVLQLSDAMADF